MHLVEHFPFLPCEKLLGTFLELWTDGHTMKQKAGEMHQGSLVQLLSTHSFSSDVILAKSPAAS